MMWRTMLAVVLTVLPLGGIAAQRGWRVQVDSNGFDEPSTSLVAWSTDKKARLELACEPLISGDFKTVDLWIGLEVDRRLGFFNSYGSGDVFVDARFLPDSTIVQLSLQVHVSSGHPNYASIIIHDDKLAMLRRADTLQAKLPLYGRPSLVVRFPIRNRDLLEKFLTKCPVASEQ